MIRDAERLRWLKSIDSLSGTFMPADLIGLRSLIDHYMRPARRTIVAERDDAVARAMNAARGMDPDQAPAVVTD